MKSKQTKKVKKSNNLVSAEMANIISGWYGDSYFDGGFFGSLEFVLHIQKSD
jgi:hypothetical protein